MTDASTQPTQPANLYMALAEFQSVLPSVKKGQTARVQGRDGKSGYSYDYADLTDVTEAILPALANVGLAWVTMVNTADDQITLDWVDAPVSGGR